MKQKFLKTPLLLFLIGIIMVSCELQEEAINQHEHNHENSKIKFKKITLNDIQHEKLVIDKIDNASKISGIKKNNLNKIVSDTINDFFIDTEKGLLIESENYTSYTFKVNRLNGSSFLLENLVISKEENKDYETYLYQYDITQQELDLINQSVSIDLSNKISIVTLENSNLPTDILNKEDYNGMCFVETTTYTPGQRCNQPGNHSWEDVLDGARCTVFGTINGPWPGSYTTSATLQPCPTGGGDASGGTGTSSSSSTSSYNGGSGGTGGPNTITTSPVNNCITGNCIEANPTDPCANSNTAVANANALFNSPQVQQGMNAVLIQKINDEGQLSLLDQKEWGVAIGQTGSTYNVTAPRHGSADQGSIPSSQVTGNYVADGHSHPNWGYADPSAEDLYGMLTSIQTNTNLKYRFVYGVAYGNSQDIDTYALIVTDPNAAEAFLTQFPQIQNTNAQSHGFLEDTEIGSDYFDAKRLFGRGFSSNLSDETYAPGAVGLAAILDKNNAGICIAKKDANGNFKKINATLVEKTDANGNKTQEVMVSKCQ